MLKHLFGLTLTVSLSVFVRMSGSAFNFVANVYLARIMGPAEFGIYTLAIAWLYILVIGARLGFDQSPTPVVAAMRGKGEDHLVRQFMMFSLRWVAAASLMVVVLGVLTLYGASDRLPDHLENVLPLIFAALPTLAISQFMESTFRGLGRVQFAWIPMSLLQPAAFLGLVFVAFGVLRLEPSGYTASAALLVSLAVALGTLTVEWFREVFRRPARRSSAAHRSEWLKISTSMIVGGSFSVLMNQTTTVLTGITDTIDAGLFGAATRLANIVGLVTGTLFGVVGNRLAVAHARGDHVQFNCLLLSAAGLIAAVSIPAFVIGAIFHTPLLSVMGNEFTRATHCLILLFAYQAFLAFANLATLALNMMGNHGAVARLLIAHIVVNFPLSGGLIYWAGINGAAAALVLIALSIALTAWYQLLRVLKRASRQ